MYNKVVIHIDLFDVVDELTITHTQISNLSSFLVSTMRFSVGAENASIISPMLIVGYSLAIASNSATVKSIPSPVAIASTIKISIRMLLL